MVLKNLYIKILFSFFYPSFSSMRYTDRLVVILNLPDIEFEEQIKSIQALHRNAPAIKLSNSFGIGKTIISHLQSKIQAIEIVKNLHNEIIKKGNEKTTIKAYLYDSIKDLIDHEAGEFQFLNHFKTKNIYSHQFNMRYESLIATNDKSLNLYKNTHTDMTKTASLPSLLSVGSPNGLFIASTQLNRIDIIATNNELDVFAELFIDNILNLYWVNDVYLAVSYRKIWEITVLYNVITSTKVFIGKLEGKKIKMNEQKNAFYLEETNQLFYNEELKQAEIFNYTYPGKFVQQRNILGYDIENVNVYYEFNGIEALWMNSNKVSNIKVFFNKQLKLSKNYTNVEQHKFYNSENRLFCMIHVQNQDRNLFSLDSFSIEGNITTTQFDSKITNFACTDTMFVITNQKNNMAFYKLQGNIFNQVNTISKKQEVIIALHKNVAAIYDTNTEVMEFYDGGKRMLSYKHPSANKLEWSKSGLYCISASIGPNMTGQIQVYDRNGRFLYKKILNNLINIQWRGFVSIYSKIKQDIINKFESELHKVEEEENEMKEAIEKLERITTEESINKWKQFIGERRDEILKYEIK